MASASQTEILTHNLAEAVRRLLATELHLRHTHDVNCSVCQIPESASFNPNGLSHKADCPWLAVENALKDWDDADH